MKASDMVEAILDSYGAKRSPEGTALVQRLFAEATWKLSHWYNGSPDGSHLTIECDTRKLTAEEEELLREVVA